MPEHAQSLYRSLRADEIAAYHRDGFVVVRGFLAPDELTPLRSHFGGGGDISAIQTRVRDGGGSAYKVAIWTDLDDSLLGMLPRMERLISAVERLMGTSCYHWHSKLLRKLPGDGAVGIHQDYATWYEDGCLFPQLVSCTLSLDGSRRENGGVYYVPQSHRMARIHRVLLGNSIDQHGPDPAYVAAAVKRLGIAYPRLDAGDALFFHCNTLHGSQPNTSNQPRSVIHCSYNAECNQPLPRPGQAHHRYRPLVRVADDFITAKRYATSFDVNTFHAPETEESVGAGIFYRNADRDVAQQST